MSEKFACVVYEEKMVGTEQGGPWIEKLKSSAIAFSFAWFFLSFFNDHFILFLLANVAANHKTTTTGSDMLNKIVGVLKYAHDKIGAGVVER